MSQISGTRRSAPGDGCDVFHAFMVEGASFAGPYDLPVLEPTYLRPSGLIRFEEAVSGQNSTFDATVHFFADDVRCERFWKNPRKYLARLKRFEAVIAPDFSTCPDFPVALKLYNMYRNQVSAHWLQRNGILVIPNVRCEIEMGAAALSGIPHNATIAIGSHGCIKNVDDRRRFEVSLKMVVDELSPSNIVVAGSDAYGVFDYPKSLGIVVDSFPLGVRVRQAGWKR